ncbi:hypothetical protein [Micromonospora echinospora]|uniref:hypothetical protein n=1 Tax=Micromonospora echinospora TaxID=1877 RepID=UPI003A878C88
MQEAFPGDVLGRGVGVRGAGRAVAPAKRRAAVSASSYARQACSTRSCAVSHRSRRRRAVWAAPAAATATSSAYRRRSAGSGAAGSEAAAGGESVGSRSGRATRTVSTVRASTSRADQMAAARGTSTRNS